MVIVYHLKTDNFWDILEVLVLKHFFIVLPVLWKIYCSKSEHFGFIIIILQLGELLSYSSDISNTKTITSNLALEKNLNWSNWSRTIILQMRIW